MRAGARVIGAGLTSASYLASAASAASGTLGIYLATVSLAGSGGRPARFGVPTPSAHDATPVHRFRIMIPAHNEQAVISRGLSTLQALRYPAEQFQVHVVADNCTDDTAAIVRSHGFVAHERTDPHNPGKGPALNWLFDRLDAGDDFDAVVVIDADTSVHPDFLIAMDAALARGHKAPGGIGSLDDVDGPPAEAAQRSLEFVPGLPRNAPSR